jgi:SpoU rRNA methylase family enzyme
MSKSRDIADSAATINYIDNVTSDVQSQINTLDNALDNISVTSGTLTKTFTAGESSTINLTSSVLAPVVSVTKEVPQSGVTNNSWDVNSTTENYTRLDSAPATTLTFAGLFDLSGASFVDSFDVSSQDTSPHGVAFNNDGTKMFIAGLQGLDINEYTLSSAFDVSTASFVDSFSVSSQDSAIRDVEFNADGTKMYVVGDTNNSIFQYSLSTAFDVSTASYDSVSFSVASQETNPSGMAFNTDGTKMFVLGRSGDDVGEYALSTGFDISTASFTDSFSVASQETGPEGIAFNTDGTKMFIVGEAGDDVNVYTLSTGFDVSSASYTSNFSISSQEADPTGIAFSASGDKMFIVGLAGDDVNEYEMPVTLTLGTGSFASADVGKTIEANSGAFVLTATDGSIVETITPTSYDQVASGDWGMYGVVYNAADGDLELSGTSINTFDVSTAVYSQALSISAQEANPSGIAFNTDGSKMFIVGRDLGAVHEYTLSTNYDISTALFVDSFSISGQETDPQGMAFNTDGTKMFIVGTSGDDVNEYTLSTAFDVSTASFVDAFSISAQETSPTDIAFSADGTAMFITGAGGEDVNKYTLSTGFDVSTASYTNSYSVASQDTAPMGIAFNADGTKMFITGNDGNDVNEYTVSTPYDPATSATFVDSFSLASQDTTPSGIAFNTDGTKMFIVGSDGDDINEYTVGTLAAPSGYQPVHTTSSTDTQYWTDINSMTADQAAGDGNVYYAISTDDRTTWTVIDNTDGERDIVRNNAGTWQYNSNGTYASETWVNGTTNTELATLAEAMEGASSVANTFDVSTAVYSAINFSLSSQDTEPTGIAFNSDGTKMFVSGKTGQDINEYTLSTGFDVSTASYSQNFSVASQETQPQDIAFNNDGTKMFVVGSVSDAVNEYVLSTGFDVSTATYSQNFSVAAQDTSPRGVKFNADGTKMFVLGTTGQDVNEYTLSTGFDVSTATFVDSFSVSAQETFPIGLAFSVDGTKMFITGGGDDVNEYTLSTAFDVSTASFVDSFSVAAQDTNPYAVEFNADGSKMFIVGVTNLSVFEYSVGTTSYTNQMDKTQLDAVTDPNHIALGNDLDLAIVFNMTSGSTVPSSDGVAINYDANVLNKGAVLGTDYDFDAPAQDKVRITALAGNNLKVRVV